MKPEHSYYDYVHRVHYYIIAAELGNDAYVLYMSILIEYNRKHYLPVSIPERKLLQMSNISHATFIRRRRDLLSHQLITINSDGVTAATYTVELAPVVVMDRLPPVENIRFINQHTYKTRAQLKKEAAAIEKNIIDLSRRELMNMARETELDRREAALTDKELAQFEAEREHWKNNNA